jgi:MerR family transcriptional regulator, light-induced transcriptional regulator
LALQLERSASRAIDADRGALAEAITARHYELSPGLERRFGPAGRAKCLQDAHHHLSYLSESISSALPTLFADYVAWAKVMLESRGVPAADLARNLEVIREVLRERLPEGAAILAAQYVEAGLERLPELPSEAPAHVADDEPLGPLARDYLAALLRGERQAASRLVLDAVESGVPVKDIYLQVFQKCQREVGRLWQMNRLSVAEEHYCTAATQLVMSQLYPRVFSGERNGRTLVATCVAGDLHEIGVRMVSDFFEMEGWDTYYVGANAPAESVVRAVAERGADVLAVSTTITSHVRALREVITAVRANEACRGVKVLVGGYPFNVAPDLWREVGADAVAPDAEAAVEIANRLVGARDAGGAAAGGANSV